MYDIHCHMLPAFDDGAKDLETALQMARIAVDDGITHLACTPHIYPGAFDNNTNNITVAVNAFKAELKHADIQLDITIGADIQLVSEMPSRLKAGSMPTINGSRYFLFEPPHHIPPPQFEASVFNIVAAGYVPLITHPERLHWVETHYDQFLRIADLGAWMQITAGSLNGRFGERPQYWAEKMLDDGIVYVIASDAHNTENRAPYLAEGEDAASHIVGATEARALVYDRPKAIWENQTVENVTKPPGYNEHGELDIKKKKGFFKRFFPGL